MAGLHVTGLPLLLLLLLLVTAPLLLQAADTADNSTQMDVKTGWPRCEPGGWYTVAHGEYCDRYYTCSHGSPFLGQCEDGLAYQPRAGCRLLHLVDCKGRPKLQPARGHGDCPRLNGVYGGAGGCSPSYTLCVSGTATPAACAHGYLFDAAAMMCRRPRSADEERCAQGPQLLAGTTPAPEVAEPQQPDNATEPASDATPTQPPPPSDQQPYYPTYYYYPPYYYPVYGTSSGQQQPYYYQYQPPATTQEPYYMYYAQQPYYTGQYYWQAGDWYSSTPPPPPGPATICAPAPAPVAAQSPAILVPGFLSPVQAPASSSPPPVKSGGASQPSPCAPDIQVTSIPGFSCPANDTFPYGDHSRHAYPGSCRLFIMCLQGGSHKVGGCPPGFAFSTSSGTCELATAVPGCGGATLAS